MALAEPGARRRDNEAEPVGEIKIEYPRALRPVVKDGAVYTVPVSKRYRPIVTKGVVTEGGIIRPFGYKG